MRGKRHFQISRTLGSEWYYALVSFGSPVWDKSFFDTLTGEHIVRSFTSWLRTLNLWTFIHFLLEVSPQDGPRQFPTGSGESCGDQLPELGAALNNPWDLTKPTSRAQILWTNEHSKWSNWLREHWIENECFMDKVTTQSCNNFSALKIKVNWEFCYIISHSGSTWDFLMDRVISITRTNRNRAVVYMKK